MILYQCAGGPTQIAPKEGSGCNPSDQSTTKPQNSGN